MNRENRLLHKICYLVSLTIRSSTFLYLFVISVVFHQVKIWLMFYKPQARSHLHLVGLRPSHASCLLGLPACTCVGILMLWE